MESAVKYTGSRKIILKENVSLDSYFRYCKHKQNYPVCIYLDNRIIKVYEVSDTFYSTASVTIKGFMFIYFTKKTNNTFIYFANVALFNKH